MKQKLYSLIPWIVLMEDFFEWSAEGSSVSLILAPRQMNLSRKCHEFVTSSVVSRVARVTLCHVASAAAHNLESEMAIDKWK